MDRLQSSLAVAALLLIALTGTVAAQDAAPKADPVAEALKDIADAISATSAKEARARIERAEAIAAKLDSKQVGAVVDALAGCIQKTKRKHPETAVAAIETLGDLRVAGSSDAFKSLLRVPSKLTDRNRALHLAAIESAGEIADPARLKDLHKLVKHKQKDVAIAACKALSGYAGMKPRLDRLKFVALLAQNLAAFEKTAAKTRSDEKREHANAVMMQVRVTMGRLAPGGSATTASEWQPWLRDEIKRERQSGPKTATG